MNIGVNRNVFDRNKAASKRPEVSVIISIYNGKEDINRTLDSLFSQIDCNFEVVVIDDGSRDISGKILDQYASQEPRLRVIHQQNTGLTKALIRGCAEARGEFIARQDVGDISLPGRLAQQAKALRENLELSFVSCGTRFVGPSREYLFVQKGTGCALYPVNIINLSEEKKVIDGPSSHPSVMFRKDKYIEAGGYRAEFYFAQDWDLWYRLAMLGKFQMLGDVLVECEVGINGISAWSKKAQNDLASLARQSLELRLIGQSDRAVLEQASQIRPSNAPDSGSGRKIRASGCYFIGECLRRNGNFNAASHYLRQAISHDPVHMKSWIRLGMTVFSQGRR